MQGDTFWDASQHWLQRPFCKVCITTVCYEYTVKPFTLHLQCNSTCLLAYLKIMHQDLLLTKLLMNITLPTLKMWCTDLILKLCRCISSRIANQGFYFHIKYYIWLVCAQLNPLKIRVVLWTLVKCLYCNFYLNSITFLSQLFCLCTVGFCVRVYITDTTHIHKKWATFRINL